MNQLKIKEIINLKTEKMSEIIEKLEKMTNSEFVEFLDQNEIGKLNNIDFDYVQNRCLTIPYVNKNWAKNIKNKFRRIKYSDSPSRYSE